VGVFGFRSPPSRVLCWLGLSVGDGVDWLLVEREKEKEKPYGKQR